MAARSEWTWMPHPAHHIMGRWCRFHLATCVGDWIVSTVGEYLPDEGVREIIAHSRGVLLEGRGDARLADFMRRLGHQEVGCGRLYETYVFPARANDYPSCCCAFVPADWAEVDSVGCNTPAEAYANHLRLCELWAGRPPAWEDATR